MTKQEMTIENITETFTGIKYAYEKEKEFDTEFIAECIEHGEEFYSTFFAPKTYTARQLHDIGFELAMGWGGECIGISKVLKHNADDTLQVVRIK